MTTKQSIYFVHLSTFLAVCLWDITSSQGSACQNGWFGTECLYKCHCDNDDCYINGTCIGLSRCTSGWFGPACQYLDLLQTNSSQKTPSWLNDNDATTCNTDQNSQSLTITLQDVFYFTWLRLHVNTSGISLNYTLHFNSTIDGQLTECTKMTRVHVNDTVSDIHCDPGVLFQQLILTGDGVPFLCSIYISGGRNVALKQYTNQTSTLNSSPRPSPISDKAVDGNINSNIDYNLDSNSCTHTSNIPLPQTWTLVFQRQQLVNRYVIFNRDSFQERLNGFVLEADTTDGTRVFRYNATKPNQSTYAFWSNSLTGVSQVTISVYNFLTLCEVEMFGDAICAIGTYGQECEQMCNCATPSDKCYISTGGCPSGCAAGYHGEYCQQRCRATFFGIDCAQKCSVNCTDQSCDAKTGTCYFCVTGTKGLKCESECEPKSYGLNCTEMCSTNCDGQFCNAKTGICNSCVAGKMGEMCNQTCTATNYGNNCAQKCSTSCTNQLCSPTDGICQSCVPGKQGPMCESDCEPKHFGENCSQICNPACKDQLCHTVTGICTSCASGNTGELCDQGLSGSEDHPPVAAIVGPIAACAALTLLFVIAMVIWRRRHRQRKDHQRNIINVYNIPDGVRPESNELYPKYATFESSNYGNAHFTTPVDADAELSPKWNVYEDPDGTSDYCNSSAKVNEPEDIPAYSSDSTAPALSPENQNINIYKNISA